MNIQKSKKCKKCGFDLLLEKFGFNPNTKDQKHTYCHDCMRKYNREKYLANKDKVIARVLKWNSEHPEQFKEYQKKYKNKNK